MKYLPFFIFVFSITLFADDIYLKNSQVYRNVRIISEDSSQVLIRYNNIERSITLNEIERIDRTPYKPLQPSKLDGGFFGVNGTPGKSKPNLVWLTVSALALLNTWDCFSDVSNIDASIQAFEKSNSSAFKDLAEDLKSQKLRKQIIGYASLVVAAITIYVAFDIDPVYTKLDSNGLTLSLRF